MYFRVYLLLLSREGRLTIDIIKGIGLLLGALGLFSLFSLRMPKGQEAMSGLANAAVATFLVEAIHKYISGDLLSINFLGSVGHASGGMGGVAAVILVGLGMKINPVYAVVAGVAAAGYGILPGFVAGYVIGLIAPELEKRLPLGLDLIIGALLLAPIARLVAYVSDPIVTLTLDNIGQTISIAANQSPYIMGFLLGGIIKNDLYFPIKLNGPNCHVRVRGSFHGYCGYCLRRRFFYKWNSF